MWSNAVVYKGKMLFKKTEDCSAAQIDDFHEVIWVCPNKKGGVIARTWIDGIEKAN